MGGTYSLPNPDYKFGEAIPRSFDPPRPEDLPQMELVEAPSENIENIKLLENVKGALNESVGLLDELNRHVELNNLQEKTSEKNNLIYRDLSKHVQNQASKLIDSHEEYDTNLQNVKYTINNSNIKRGHINILLVITVILFII